LTKDLRIVHIQLPGGRLGFRDHVVNTFNERVESFIVDEDGIIHFLTNKGDIRNVSDEGKRICCAQGSNLIVKYWNKIISVGSDSFLVAGYSTDKEIESFNSLILVRGNSSNLFDCLDLKCYFATDQRNQHNICENPILKMVELKTKRSSNLSFVLAAEFYYTVHLLMVRTGQNQSLQAIDKNTSLHCKCRFRFTKLD